MNAKTPKALPLLMLLLAAGGAQAARADDYPTKALGIQPEKAYQHSNVDHINIFNGNLTLIIPIGQRYPLGADFSYGLNLVYNSNIWDFVATTTGQTNLTSALPKHNSNAGMGWLLTLGQLQEPTDPSNQTGVWLYVGEDGNEHRLYPTLHNEDAAASGIQYLRDGTYLRLRGPYGTVIYLDFPDGSTRTFTNFGTYDWRLTNIQYPVNRLHSPPNNSVAISYPTYPTLHWVLNDNWGRTSTVWFEPTTTCPADFGCYQYRVASVVVPIFSNNGQATYATYGFQYTDQSVPRACPSDDPSFPSPFTESFLTGISLPDGSSWSMPAAAYLANTADCKAYGILTNLVLPTRGQLQWSYGTYSFPNEEGSKHLWRTGSPGVASRSELSASGGVLGTWTYTPSLTYNAADPQHAVEAVRLLQTPLNHTTASYFSVATSAGYALPPWTPVEYGLPLTHNQSDPYTGYPLSTKIYPCVVTDPANPPCSASRTTYIAYAADTVSPDTAVTTESRLDQRVVGERTIYNDDGGTTSASAYSNFDGLGHYRQEDTSGNFSSGGNVRTTVTDFNPGNGTYPGSFALPSTNGTWVLGTYDFQSAAEGSGFAYTRSCFDGSTGFLLRKRVRAGGASDGLNDLLVVYGHDDDGNVSAEDYFGGDLQPLPTSGDTCTLALGQPGPYHIDKTYQSGTLATSRYLGVPFYSLFRTIDNNTGLPLASQDTSQLTTAYTYDAMGRILSLSPPGQLNTLYTYTPASPSAKAAVDIATSSDTTHSVLVFDDLGRVTQESRLDPSGYNSRQTLYDGAGNKASVSEWGSFGSQTQYLYYDPFGRATQIALPDGHMTQLAYYGAREVDRTAAIAVGGSEQQETTREIYDRQGRLAQVQEPPGGTVTTYGYDVGNRLSSVTATGSGTSQVRYFAYDNRGFLNWEQHPEKGASGNGTVSYSAYDALGHPGNIVDGPNNLLYQYDPAGRLAAVLDGNHGNRPLKTFSYSSSNGSNGSGFSEGKLLQASRFNYVTASGSPATAEIRHNYSYGDGSVSHDVGRVTNRTTGFFVNGGATAAETYSQTFSYDGLGNVQTLGYPQCVAGGCGGAAGADSVSFNYTRSLLTSVPGYADGITYSPSRQVYQVQHHNGITDTITADPNFMPRPGAVSTAPTSNPNAPYWQTGAYAYDGAGNIKSIGAASFVYDPVSRLTASTLYTDPVTPIHAVIQSTLFDAFGNIQSITTNGVGMNTPTSSSINHLQAPTTYDGAGNVTFWMNQNYTLDAFNQMSRFCGSTCGSGEDWTYMYDADDQRTWLFKNYQNTYRRTLRDLGGNVLRDYFTNAATTTVEDYVYRSGQLLAAVTTTNGSVKTTHFSLDHLGTPRLVTSSGSSSRATSFYTLSPCRILDTRQTGVPLTQTNPQQTYQVSGVCGVPAGALAVAVNATLVGATTALSVQGYPGDLAAPGTNVVSVAPPRTILAGAAVLPLATNGSGTLGVRMTLTPPATSGRTDLTIDVAGYFAAAPAGSVVAYHAYFPNGVEATAFAQDAERMKFTGHERDLNDPSSPADDLDYMHARSYNPQLGRFLSVDTHYGNPKWPQSWNRYSYGLGNPLRHIDPDGQGAMDVVSGAGQGLVNLGVHTLEGAKAIVTDPKAVANGLVQAAKIAGHAYFSSAGRSSMASSFASLTTQEKTAVITEAVGAGVVMALGPKAVSAIRGAEATTTVTHFTSEAGMQSISSSGTLRAGTFVALSSEIPAGAGAAAVEHLLEIGPGKGAYSITFSTPSSNLMTPANGVLTSGGATQFQLIQPQTIEPSTFVATAPPP